MSSNELRPWLLRVGSSADHPKFQNRVEERTCLAGALETHDVMARIAQPAEEEARRFKVTVEAAARLRNAFGVGEVERSTGQNS